jgi:hypothetical protein
MPFIFYLSLLDRLWLKGLLRFHKILTTFAVVFARTPVSEVVLPCGGGGGVPAWSQLRQLRLKVEDVVAAGKYSNWFGLAFQNGDGLVDLVAWAFYLLKWWRCSRLVSHRQLHSVH